MHSDTESYDNWINEKETTIFDKNRIDLLKACCSPNKDDLKVAQTKWNKYVDSTLQNLTSISKKYKPILKNMLNPDVNQRKTMSP